MIAGTMNLSTLSDVSMIFHNGWMASAGLSSIVLDPLVMIALGCLIGLLILGGLWLQGRKASLGSHRERSTGTSTELPTAYDYVTGLPTGRLFGTLLEQAVDRAQRTGRSLALLVVELDHFRMVAERQGQANGNVLVRVQAARVKGVLRSTETVARLAQDQFAMVLDNFTSPQEVSAIIEKLQATVGLPLTLEGQELFLTCRIGIAFFPQDAREQEGLIDQAMRALKTAKSDGQAVRFASPIPAVSSSDPESAPSRFANLLP
ncbi:MAG: GGDEF domain-containing protein [Nitrospiraceae bacterium]|nr:GGDEF domain-containing protein [Nitrospiraceae bacterium]